MLKGIAILTLLLSSPAFAWKISQIKGSVQVISGEKSNSAKTNMELKDKDVIQTGDDGKALIEDKGAKIYVASKSKIQINQSADKASGEWAIDAGKIRAIIEKQMNQKEYPYKFKTPVAVMGVRGTEFFIANENGDEKYCTLDGIIHVEIQGKPKDPFKPSWFDLHKGQGLFIVKGIPSVKKTTETQVKNWVSETSF